MLKCRAFFGYRGLVSFCSEKRPFFPGRREDHKTFNIEIGGGVGWITISKGNGTSKSFANSCPSPEGNE